MMSRGYGSADAGIDIVDLPGKPDSAAFGIADQEEAGSAYCELPGIRLVVPCEKNRFGFSAGSPLFVSLLSTGHYPYLQGYFRHPEGQDGTRLLVWSSRTALPFPRRRSP